MNEPAAAEVSLAPLKGVRIIAVEQFGAGPFGTLLLADLGAEVIKIEDPAASGDVGRTVPPGAADGSSLYFEAFNRGKRSIALDLTSAAGREVFSSLVATADAVYNNLRGDPGDRRGDCCRPRPRWRRAGRRLPGPRDSPGRARYCAYPG